MGFTFNQINIGGNLTRDIEMVTTPGGTVIGKTAVAVNERKKNGTEWIDDVIFMDITLFGKLAERCDQYLKKGDAAIFVGRLQQDKWTDKEGQKRTKMHVIASDVVFVKWGKDNSGGKSIPEPPGGADEAPF